MSTYGSDSEMTSLLNQMDVYVLPVFNIDGYAYTWSNVCHPFLNIPYNAKPRTSALKSNVKLPLSFQLTGQNVEEDPFQEVWYQLYWY